MPRVQLGLTSPCVCPPCGGWEDGTKTPSCHLSCLISGKLPTSCEAGATSYSAEEASGTPRAVIPKATQPGLDLSSGSAAHTLPTCPPRVRGLPPPLPGLAWLALRPSVSCK